MKQTYLLIGGLALVAASVIGPSVEGSPQELGSGRVGWHMSGPGHMGGSNNATSPDSEIDGAPEITITTTEFAFSPAEITVAVGDSLNLTLINEGGVPHDLSVPELGVHMSVGPGQRVTTGVSFDTAGTFEVLCTYPGHAGAGMVGTLTVTG